MELKLWDATNKVWYSQKWAISPDFKTWFDEKGNERKIGKDFVICRAVGKRDKKGNPLFEGDVVKHHDYIEGHDRYIICYGWMKRGGIGFYQFNPDEMSYYYDNYSVIEKIGNIYENNLQHLLKNEQYY